MVVRDYRVPLLPGTVWENENQHKMPGNNKGLKNYDKTCEGSGIF